MNEGGPTVRAIWEVAVCPPPEPVMVTAYLPATAEVDAFRVRVLSGVDRFAKDVAGLGEIDAVTPGGSPETVSWTTLLNPFCVYKFTDVVADAPSPRFTSLLQSEKLGALIVTGMIVVAVWLPDTPVIFRLY